MAVVNLNINIPKELSAITLGQYQKYAKVLESNKDNEGSNEFINLKCLDIFCGLNLKDSYNLPVSSFDFALAQVGNCFKEPTPLHQRFTMTGTDDVEVEFGFFPDLSQILYGEYIDLDKYIGSWETMHKAMSVLYRPIKTRIKDDYLIHEYNGSEVWCDIMKDAPINIALGARLFFYRIGNKLSRHTMVSLVEERLKEGNLTETQRADLEKNGDGIKAYMHLLEEESTSLTQSHHFHIGNA
jgi:hypothetical protein